MKRAFCKQLSWRVSRVLHFAAAGAFGLLLQAHAEILSVRDFGALGDGKKDDAPAIQAAIDAALETGGEVFIPAGTYRLEKLTSRRLQVGGPGRNGHRNQTSTGHLVIANARGLAIRGEDGTELQPTSLYHHGILVANSRDVVIRSLTIDYATQPYTQGRVLTVDVASQTLTVQLDPGWGSPLREDFHNRNQARRLTLFDPETRLLDLEERQRFLVTVDANDDATFAIQLRGFALDGDEVGKRFVLTARRPANAFYLFRSIGTRLHETTVLSAPGLAYGLFEADATTLQACRVTRKPGTDRLISTNADAVHCKNLIAGPTIRDCEFLHMDDDGINVGSTYKTVLQQPEPTRVVITASDGIREGMTIHFVNGLTGELIASPEIVGLRRMAHGKMQLDLSDPVEGLVLSKESAPSNGPPIRKGQNERELPSLALPTAFVAAGTTIENNRIGMNRGRGMVCNASKATIADNRFERMEGPALCLGRDLAWLEGPNPREVEIRGNHFTHVRRSNIYVADLGSHRQILAGHEIGPLTITANTFTAPGGHASLGGWGIADNLIYLSNVASAKLDANIIQQPPATLQSLIIKQSEAIESGSAFEAPKP